MWESNCAVRICKRLCNSFILCRSSFLYGHDHRAAVQTVQPLDLDSVATGGTLPTACDVLILVVYNINAVPALLILRIIGISLNNLIFKVMYFADKPKAGVTAASPDLIFPIFFLSAKRSSAPAALYIALSVPLPIMGCGFAVFTMISALTLVMSFRIIWNGISSPRCVRQSRFWVLSSIFRKNSLTKWNCRQESRRGGWQAPLDCPVASADKVSRAA